MYVVWQVQILPVVELKVWISQLGYESRLTPLSLSSSRARSAAHPTPPSSSAATEKRSAARRWNAARRKSPFCSLSRDVTEISHSKLKTWLCVSETNITQAQDETVESLDLCSNVLAFSFKDKLFPICACHRPSHGLRGPPRAVTE